MKKNIFGINTYRLELFCTDDEYEYSREYLTKIGFKYIKKLKSYYYDDKLGEFLDANLLIINFGEN